ncbi:MAG: hypothetical protein L0J24_02165 [Corynebacterium flavescens]|uniref:hypothetical protein n=1 Tax=Corynebacterium flavescens TaxID=28028 RepID=UPI00265442FD|nr:hypothetical protein [Corynebacterium flavescens]
MEPSMTTVAGQVFTELVLVGLAPALGIFAFGCICHRLLPPKLALLKLRARGTGRFGARRIAFLAVLAGSIVGAITLSPLPFELAVMVGALCFCVFVAVLQWLTGDVISGVFISVPAMLAGAAAFESLLFFSRYGVHGADYLDVLRGEIATMWTVYAFPGFVAAIITAFVILSSLKAEHEYDQRVTRGRIIG